jgi:hypothetical protein
MLDITPEENCGMPAVEDLPLRNTSTGVEAIDRRRDGRIDYSNPHLIELLRRPEFPSAFKPAAPEKEPNITIPPVPPQEATMGFVVTTSICFWIVISAVIWRVF